MKWKCNIRKQSYDDYILKQVEKTYNLINPYNKIILDVGACFGAVSTYFATRKALLVIAVEPEIKNFLSLVKNSQYYNNILPLFGAVTETNDTLGNLYKHDSNDYMHSLIRKTYHKKTQIVPLYNFNNLLEVYKPNVLKIDCEGAELNFLNGNLPHYVSVVFVEFHLGSSDKLLKAREIIKSFKTWKTLVSPFLIDEIETYPGTACAFGVWSR
jgi:FkbM family methyltransferase